MSTKKKKKTTGTLREDDLSPTVRDRLAEYFRLLYLYEMVLSRVRSDSAGSGQRAHFHASSDLMLTKEEELLIDRVSPTSLIRRAPAAKTRKKQTWKRPGQNRERKRAG